jgi:hypothetical protein
VVSFKEVLQARLGKKGTFKEKMIAKILSLLKRFKV